MAGIYIHIPFCKKACHYCNFHFSTSHQLLPQLVESICYEAELRNDYLNEDIATIYFGGGTPSLLTIADLQLMIKKLHSLFNINNDVEITLEANPDDINIDKLKSWKAAGINRLSIGVQSFFDEDLQWLNRAHNAKQAYVSVEEALQNGFENISIDLIYGTPGLSNERWFENVRKATSLQIPHLSCYALTVEENTALHKMIIQQKKENINNNLQGEHFELLMQWTEEAGYEHYEISNFAKPGLRSKHNSSYWQIKNYLGLGPSAHSYNGNSRQWNINNNALYIKSLEQNKVPFEIEYLTRLQKLNEYIMTSLRTAEGMHLQKIVDLSDAETLRAILKDAKMYLQNESLQLSNENLMLTKKGKLFADKIASDLFRLNDVKKSDVMFLSNQ